MSDADRPAQDNDPAPPPPEAEVDPAAVGPRVEAALLTSDRALSSGRIAEALGLESAGPIHEAIKGLNESYEATGRCFRIEQVAGGWQMMTLPAFWEVLAALNRGKSQSKLSAAALETLAIVAYKQPVLRAELESIRGVACGETLKSLMERHLVKIAGRAEELGRPMLYGTTRQFLELFGLSSLKDLPKIEDLQAGRGL